MKEIFVRRKDREIIDIESICSIIDICKVFRIAISVNNVPYIVPLNFGYEFKNNHFNFYFHCANEGRKIDMIRKNDTVCFEMDCWHEMTAADTACSYGYLYKSVVGTGKVKILNDTEDKINALNILMYHQTGKDFSFTENQVSTVTVCRIDVLELSAKQRTT
ncbi:MAG: pyridoxamine 5'-phosphate oxidase family protein [Bacillota bacterium]|nr:pyridoxamine 5'-phosphate oxidase family protein [Bacillota bacterium]